MPVFCYKVSSTIRDRTETVPPETTTSQTEQCLFGLLTPRSCLPPKVCYIRNGIKQKLSSDRNGTVQKLSSDRNYLRRLLSNYAKLRVGNPTQKKEHSPFFADRLATLGVCLIPLTKRGLYTLRSRPCLKETTVPKKQCVHWR